MVRVKKSLLITALLLYFLPLLLFLLRMFAAVWHYPALFPQKWSLPFARLQDPLIFPAFFNTLFIASTASLLGLFIALPAAKSLAFDHFRGKRFVASLIYLPLILPPVAVLSGLHYYFIQLALDGKISGLLLVHVLYLLPYQVQLLWNGYRQIGSELLNAGRNLGANDFQIFWRIERPLLWPSILSSFAMGLAVSVSQYLTTFMIGGGNYLTLPLLLMPYAQNGKDQLAAFLSFLLVLCGIGPMLLAERWAAHYKDRMKGERRK